MAWISGVDLIPSSAEQPRGHVVCVKGGTRKRAQLAAHWGVLVVTSPHNSASVCYTRHTHNTLPQRHTQCCRQEQQPGSKQPVQRRGLPVSAAPHASQLQWLPAHCALYYKAVSPLAHTPVPLQCTPLQSTPTPCCGTHGCQLTSSHRCCQEGCPKLSPPACRGVGLRPQHGCSSSSSRGLH